MRGINHVHFIGSITQAPELKYTPGGMAILELMVAGRSEVLTEDGEVKRPAFYNRVKAFSKFAEALADVFSAGDVVSVTGRLDYRAYETQEGEKRSVVETVISSINKLAGTFEAEEDKRGQPILLHGLNQVTLGGNLTKDAELNHTASGATVARYNLAVNESYQSKGETQEKVGFYRVEAWREMAVEAVKGDGMIVIGRLANESWQDKDGNTRYGTKVEAERLHVVGSSTSNGHREAPGKSGTKASRKAPPPDEEFPPEEDLPF